MTQLVFFTLASFLIISSLIVVFSSTPVKSVLALVLCFFNAAALLLITGAEFVSAILIVVYIGAIVVLFLFVVMTLTSKELCHKKYFKLSYLPFLGLACITICTIFLQSDTSLFVVGAEIGNNIKNTNAIGSVLYTKYFLQFQLAGLVLLVGMIGAIILSQRKKDLSIKQQDVWKQLTADPRERIRIIQNK